VTYNPNTRPAGMTCHHQTCLTCSDEAAPGRILEIGFIGAAEMWHRCGCHIPRRYASIRPRPRGREVDGYPDEVDQEGGPDALIVERTSNWRDRAPELVHLYQTRALATKDFLGDLTALLTADSPHRNIDFLWAPAMCPFQRLNRGWM
jgi:hypothetical protein